MCQGRRLVDVTAFICVKRVVNETKEIESLACRHGKRK